MAAVLYADLVTKALAVAGSRREDVQVLGDWLVLHLTRNPGAAFSTGTEFTVLSAIAVAALAMVLYLSRRVGTRAWAWSSALLAGIAATSPTACCASPARSAARGGLPDGAQLAGVQRRRHLHQRRRRADPLQAIRGIGIDGTRTHAAREQEA